MYFNEIFISQSWQHKCAAGTRHYRKCWFYYKRHSDENCCVFFSQTSLGIMVMWDFTNAQTHLGLLAATVTIVCLMHVPQGRYVCYALCSIAVSYVFLQ